MNPTTTSDGKPRKHIRRACLECRKRHVRCDGVFPVCKKCADNNRECSYVPSHRGGIRIPRKKLQQERIHEQQQQQVKSDESTTWGSAKDVPLPLKGFKPCMVDSISFGAANNELVTGRMDSSGHSGFDQSLTNNSAERDLEDQLDPVTDFTQAFQPSRAQSNLEQMQEVINGVVSLSPYDDINNTNSNSGHASSHLNSPESLFNPTTTKGSYAFDSYTLSPDAEIPTAADFSFEDTIEIYYTNFHNRHPILPARSQISSYLRSTKATELLQVMSFICHVLVNGSPSLDALLPRIHIAKTAVLKAPNDIVRVQASVLLAIAAHLCTDNPTSIYLRTWCFDLCHRILAQHTLSPLTSDGFANDLPVPVDAFSSPRTAGLDKQLFSDLVARTLHELFFLDVMFSVISKGKLSPFADSDLISCIPIEDVPLFAYKSRYRTIQVVKSIILSLATLGSGIQSSIEFTRLEALVTTFQGFLADDVLPEQEFPPLLDDYGNVNDGIHQASMMLNFAAILLHFPSSSLYQNKLPSFVQCTEDSGPIMPVNKTPLPRQRVVVSTRQCIQAANNIIKIATDIGSSNIANRTPLYTCSLSMAMLVHMKAYHWLTRGETNGSSSNKAPKIDKVQRKQEIGLYEAYIKLESSSLLTYGSKWILPAKLNTSLCTVMYNVLPELYESLMETEPSRRKRKAEDHGDEDDIGAVDDIENFIEKDCWMKSLDADNPSPVINKPTLDIFDQLFDLDSMTK
ncbi:hypothetical protein D0Z00_002412 [Geotrichum galactomycetum]|uniref:Uncharacterized protein n=1 Tax=Geotrichum galactomycetum TaxID=27317 RepID=A0ACB6V4B9_9ASCO|nr:hypothetical protein D0Z00_002412 [Geotrichum candidum]